MFVKISINAIRIHYVLKSFHYKFIYLFIYEEDELIMISYFVKYGIILVKGELRNVI